jgi:hypothetical protein
LGITTNKEKYEWSTEDLLQIENAEVEETKAVPVVLDR